MAKSDRKLVVRYTVGSGIMRQWFYIHEDGTFRGGFGAQGFLSRNDAVAFLTETFGEQRTRALLALSSVSIIREDGSSIRTDLVQYSGRGQGIALAMRGVIALGAS